MGTGLKPIVNILTLFKCWTRRFEKKISSRLWHFHSISSHERVFVSLLNTSVSSPVFGIISRRMTQMHVYFPHLAYLNNLFLNACMHPIVKLKVQFLTKPLHPSDISSINSVELFVCSLPVFPNISISAVTSLWVGLFVS